MLNGVQPLTFRSLFLAALIAAALFAGGLVAGCGGGPTTPPSPSPTATATPAATPTPQVCPSPAACPQLTRFGNKPHNVLDSQHQEIAAAACNADRSVCRLSGGLKFIVYDATPNWGAGQEVCNAEHQNCRAQCGPFVFSEPRACEPFPGPLWRLEGPVILRQYQEQRYQLKVEVTGVGVIRTRTCAEPGAKDGLGFELDIAGTNCFTRSVEVVE
jgi:hypothetical protein